MVLSHCLQDWDRHQDQNMDEWVVWFYVEPFTLHLNRDKGPVYGDSQCNYRDDSMRSTYNE